MIRKALVGSAAALMVLQLACGAPFTYTYQCQQHRFSRIKLGADTYQVNVTYLDADMPLWTSRKCAETALENQCRYFEVLSSNSSSTAFGTGGTIMSNLTVTTMIKVLHQRDQDPRCIDAVEVLRSTNAATGAYLSEETKRSLQSMHIDLN